ncbi:MAG: hypothetical protein E7543_06875 [Ruminococcaceae bacterium]|nr:hypothetical protein [Oscillospiraceae bacterium]
MRKFIRKTLATGLALLMLSGSFVCFAAGLNQDAVAAHYGQYENYVLLGDSVACGYRDEVSENDAHFNDLYNETTYCRVPGSYADVIANAIIADKSMTALAGPGYRTIEMRYMLEDDFKETCTDEYLFWPSHLYAYQDQYCAECGEYLLPGSEHFRKQFKEAIAEADLITLGIGGNDWGAYLRWVIEKILRDENVADQYINDLAEAFKAGPFDLATIEKAVEIAHIAGALPALLMALPEALEYGLSNFYTNWDIMIQDIYDLNPDVTLMVVGMSDNSLKGKYYDYNGVEGEKIPVAETNEATAQAMTLIVDFIMGVGNAPMIEGAKNFGYTYVDTDGTTYVDSHPDAAGHEFIANKIIEALPSKEIYGKYSDVTPGNKYYSDIEFCLLNGILAPKSETEFGVNEVLTRGELINAVNVLNGSDDRSEDSGEVGAIAFAITLLGASVKKGFVTFFKAFTLTYKILASKSFNVGAEITKAEAAYYLNQLFGA